VYAKPPATPAPQVLQASSELSQQSEMMRGQVEAFLRNIKAA
jgi:methyl-accepting chemotaxis protein